MPKNKRQGRQFIDRVIERNATENALLSSATGKIDLSSASQAFNEQTRRMNSDFVELVTNICQESSADTIAPILQSRGWTGKNGGWVKDGVSLNSTEGNASDPRSAALERGRRAITKFKILVGTDSQECLSALRMALNAGMAYVEMIAYDVQASSSGRPNLTEKRNAQFEETRKLFKAKNPDLEPRYDDHVKLWPEEKKPSRYAFTNWRDKFRGKALPRI